MEEKEEQTGRPGGGVRVNLGYAAFQVAKALLTSAGHQDRATRERAQAKIAKWQATVDGLLNGTLDVGSRTPVKSVPGWATLEVITGGFATGELLAGGPLQAHETALLAKLSASDAEDPRRVLNGYYLTDPGLAELHEMLRSGRFDIAVPEEGALLAIAWLAQNGHAEEARHIVDELAPYFSRLRFYPVPTERPRRYGARVFLQDVASTIASLKNIEPNDHILAQREAIEIWTPLYDRMVGLFLETVEGPAPRVLRGADGKWIRSPAGQFALEGGWPCQRYPQDWSSRAQEVLNDYAQKRRMHRHCTRPDRAKDSFAQIRGYLERCARAPQTLGGRDVGRIRLLLARYVAKRDLPDSARCRELRQAQQRQAAGPSFHEIAGLAISRLEPYPKTGGLDDIGAVMQPITAGEARGRLEQGTGIPHYLQRKLQRCLVETIDVLVERGIVTSGESLARVLPQWTSGLRAAAMADPALRNLYAAIYRAFRRRRSLLLLDLQQQIQIEELPWVAAIDRFRDRDSSAKELAVQALEEVALLAIASFPQAIVPNKLLQELRALAKTAELDLPLVDELAADIFMGQFSQNFLEAARKAADMLNGTLYGAYYGIDYRQVRQIAGAKGTATSKQRSIPFLDLCEARAGVAYGSWDPAINGMIIEQQQVVTTQNLAALFGELKLADALGDGLEDLPRRCFAWICRRLQLKNARRHAQLIQIKNAAYAWRQMVFFLALLPHAKVQDFLSWAGSHLDKQSAQFRSRFSPALQGLKLSAERHAADWESGPDARRFLGWSKERHWLLTEASSSGAPA